MAIQLSTQEAADILGVTVGRVRQLCQEGRLPFKTTPYGRVFDEAEMKEQAKTRNTKPGRQTVEPKLEKDGL